MKKTVIIQYFAFFKESAEKSEEALLTEAVSLSDLYEEIKQRYQWKLSRSQCKVAVNDEFVPFEQVVKNDDRVVFIPPVAGG